MAKTLGLGAWGIASTLAVLYTIGLFVPDTAHDPLVEDWIIQVTDGAGLVMCLAVVGVIVFIAGLFVRSSLRKYEPRGVLK